MRTRLLIGSAVFVLLGTGAVGLMHHPAFRAVLMSAGGCPVSGEVSATSSQREAARQHALQGERGTTPAPMTSFFGFELGAVTRAQVEARLGAQASCRANVANLVLECAYADLSSHFGVSSAGTAFFRFDEQTRLVAMVVMPQRGSLEGSLSAFEHFTTTFENGLGAPQVKSGTADTTLGDGLLKQARREHHFTNLLGKVVASNMGDGVQVLAEVQWLPDQLAVR